MNRKPVLTRTRRCVGLLAAVLSLGIVSVSAAETLPEKQKLSIPFERYTLDNGLEVILHQDNSVPLVAVSVWYHVGSGDEVPGKSGFAHLFEHMLFQGSKHVGEDRHFKVLKQIGASGVNGTTNPDRTNYFEVVPSHQVETALWLESDRMGYLLPVVTKKSFENQVEVVRNERRQRYDNVAYSNTRFAKAAAMYPEGHPYRYLTIGRHEDLRRAKLDDVVAFYRQYYMPANATLAIGGDFEVPEMKKLVNKWFGSFPKTDKPVRRPVPAPVLTGVKAVQVDDKLAKLRRLEYVWPTPAYYAAGDSDLDIAAYALTSTGTGRLYKRLVHETQLAQSVQSYQGSRQFSSEFTLSVTLKSGADLAKVKAIIAEELGKLRTVPMSKSEFKRAVTQFESGFVWGLESVLSRVEKLQGYNHFVGDPGYIEKDLDRWRTSSPDQVRNAVAKFLTVDKRVEALTVPAKGGAK